MNKELAFKYSQLVDFITELEEVVVAYSGGVDSTLLLRVAIDTLGEEVIALIGKSETMPVKEFDNAVFTARELGVEPVIIPINETDSLDYCSNSVDRCFFCKKHIFSSFTEFMHKNRLLHLIDGSNTTDESEFQSRNKALALFDVISPLKELNFTKTEIRELSKELGLSTWAKESMTCLATRIALNDTITISKLKQIELAEDYLKELEFKQVRARLQNDSLRIEVSSAQVHRFFHDKTRKYVLDKMKALGFKHVSIDMEGHGNSSKSQNQTPEALKN
jgi:uncharacterized protein